VFVSLLLQSILNPNIVTLWEHMLSNQVRITNSQEGNRSDAESEVQANELDNHDRCSDISSSDQAHPLNHSPSDLHFKKLKKKSAHQATNKTAKKSAAAQETSNATVDLPILGRIACPSPYVGLTYGMLFEDLLERSGATCIGIHRLSVVGAGANEGGGNIIYDSEGGISDWNGNSAIGDEDTPSSAHSGNWPGSCSARKCRSSPESGAAREGNSQSDMSARIGFQSWFDSDSDIISNKKLDEGEDCDSCNDDTKISVHDEAADSSDRGSDAMKCRLDALEDEAETPADIPRTASPPPATRNSPAPALSQSSSLHSSPGMENDVSLPYVFIAPCGDFILGESDFIFILRCP
jgi:hypothetical protein